MTTRRTCECDPPVAIEYDIDSDGNPVPLRFYDLATGVVYTTANGDAAHPNAVVDAARVHSECNAVWERDQLYLSAVQAAAGIVDPAQILRFDQDGGVKLTVAADDATAALVQEAIAADAKAIGDISVNDVFVGSAPIDVLTLE